MEESIISRIITEINPRFDETFFEEENVVKLGARYYKGQTGVQTMTYLKLQQKLTLDDPKSDYFLGDATFHQAIMAYADKYIINLESVMSESYLKSTRHRFPDIIRERLHTSVSQFFYSRLLESTSKYFIDVENDERKPLLDTPKANKAAFHYYSKVWEGIQYIRQLDPETQEVIITSALVGQSNLGWPYWNRTKKTKFKQKNWLPFLKKWCRPVYNKHREYITIDAILDTIRYCSTKGLYFPMGLFYRTQSGSGGQNKVRSVYGGNILYKIIGCLLGAAKHISIMLSDFDTKRRLEEKLSKFTIEEEESILDLVQDVQWEEDELIVNYPEITWNWLPHVGAVPYTSDMDWNYLFHRVSQLCPERNEEVWKTYTKNQLKEMGHDVDGLDDGEYTIEIYGEDFTAFDMSIRPHDVMLLTKHKNFGWIYQYLLDSLVACEIWTCNRRLISTDKSYTFYLSGMPDTSKLGTYVHQRIHESFETWYNTIYLPEKYSEFKRSEMPNGGRVKCLSDMNQSDDNITWWINFDEKVYKKFCEEFGFTVSPEKASSYIDDGFVAYLKMFVGYATMSPKRTFSGDPQSRYLSFCHSERNLDEEHVDQKGVYLISEDKEVNSFLSKNASLGEEHVATVNGIIAATARSDLTKKSVAAISSIRPSVRASRMDVPIGIHPYWLRSRVEAPVEIIM